MAINPRDTPVSREEVLEWLQEYNGRIRDTKRLREYLEAKLVAKGLGEGDTVNTSEMENLGDETSIVDMIILDLDSYGLDKRD